MKSIANFQTLVNLIYNREVAEISSFSKLMQKLIMTDGKPFFDVWMYEVSDEIQSLATAYGERFVMESSMTALNSCTHSGAQKVLESTLYLHAISHVLKNIDWYILDGSVSM